MGEFEMITKEEAEWELEFGNITRTETLRLPTFEEIKKAEFFKFIGKDGKPYIMFYSALNSLYIYSNVATNIW